MPSKWQTILEKGFLLAVLQLDIRKKPQIEICEIELMI